MQSAGASQQLSPLMRSLRLAPCRVAPTVRFSNSAFQSPTWNASCSSGKVAHCSRGRGEGRDGALCKCTFGQPG